MQGADRPDLQRLDRELQIVDRAGGRGEVQHEVDGSADVDEVGHVRPHQPEPTAFQQMVHVRRRPGGEVVETDDLDVFIEQSFGEMRSEEPGRTGDDRSCHESPRSASEYAARYSSPAARTASAAPRSTMTATPTTSAPASRSASTAVSTEPPVVDVSSTANTRRPAMSGPSIRRWSPCALPSLRTTKASSSRPLAAAACSIAAATGSAPRVKPPTAT